jgi:hypothetical protein
VSFPDSLADLARPPSPPLQSVACRLDPVTLARVSHLQAQLGCPRGSLLRALVQAGLAAIDSQQAAHVVVTNA